MNHMKMRLFLVSLILGVWCCLATPSSRASVNLQSWTAAPWNATSGVTVFSGTVTDPAYLGGTSASFTFGNPKTGVNITVPSAPNFGPATASFFGFEPTGFGVGDNGLGRFTRGESFTLQADHAFDLQQINWAEYTGDEVLHIHWTHGGVVHETLYYVTANPSVFGSTIIADAGTPVIITNVSASTANLSGRLRHNKIVVALADDPAPADPVVGSYLILNNWLSAPWNATNGTSSFGAALTAPENGGTPAGFTLNNPQTGVNVSVPESPNFSSAVSSFFGFEGTGFGVGNSGLGRFDRGESFTLQCVHDFMIEEILWYEYTGDEKVHIKWTSGGTVREQVFNITASRFAFADLAPDANTPVVFTNVSPLTAHLSGRLRLNYMVTALLFASEPVYSAAGPDGFQQMFGVNLAGGEFGTVPGTYGTDYIYPNANEMDYYNAKGLKLIRLPFKWERVQPTLNGSLSSTEMGRIDNVINMANARGMKVVLDMHNYARRGGNIIGSTALPNSAFQDVWKKLADRYKTSTAIYGYGIMNEPHDTGGLWPAAAQAAANGIREVDTTHWIVVGGDGWSSASGWAGNNPNLNVQDAQNKVIYEAHCYFDNNSDGVYNSYDSEGAYPNIGVLRVNPFITWLKARGARGFIGEYGVPKNDARWNVVLDRFMSHLYANGLSGTYWAGGPWWGSYPLSCEPTSNFTVDAPQMSVLENYTF